MKDVFAAIDRLPKAELHMHIEGSIEPEMMLDLGRRNGIALPWRGVEEARAAYRFGNLKEFLDVFYRGLSVIVTEDDFFAVTDAYLRRAHADGIVHAELFISPQAHLGRGIGFDTMMRGVLRAFESARGGFGMSLKLIPLFQRHLPEEGAFPILDMAEPWRHEIAGFGLAGAELGNPPQHFERLFAHCRDLGYPVVAHAGEEGPAAYVRDSLDLLKVKRIDHGVRAADDPGLVDRLVREAIPLTVCPMANVRLGVFSSFAEHNLKALFERGVKVTVNSDDPSYFGAYLGDILKLCVGELGMGFADIVQLLRNSFEAAFLPERENEDFVERLHQAANASAD
ncbi:MAG: adenosine deaminase [Rhizobiales bacterium 65-79]|jgi:adenosine deaminase|nr:adenosine deaminase [Hyphomicrobiales bacterium]OJU01429.1 MAG: adenosine deaminase [Rhizobiales bacterium 65-79]